MRALESACVAREFYDGELHTVAKAKVWNFVDSGEICRQNHSFGAPMAEASGHNNSVEVVEFLELAFVLFVFFRINPDNIGLAIISGSIRPVGLMICSTICAPLC